VVGGGAFAAEIVDGKTMVPRSLLEEAASLRSRIGVLKRAIEDDRRFKA
jgi:hypothetical protein